MVGHLGGYKSTTSTMSGHLSHLVGSSQSRNMEVFPKLECSILEWLPKHTTCHLNIKIICSWNGHKSLVVLGLFYDKLQLIPVKQTMINIDKSNPKQPWKNGLYRTMYIQMQNQPAKVQKGSEPPSWKLFVDSPQSIPSLRFSGLQEANPPWSDKLLNLYEIITESWAIHL